MLFPSAAASWTESENCFSELFLVLGVLQVDSLTERVDELKQDKKRLVEEYEAKLSKVPQPSTQIDVLLQ